MDDQAEKRDFEARNTGGSGAARASTRNDGGGTPGGSRTGGYGGSSGGAPGGTRTGGHGRTPGGTGTGGSGSGNTRRNGGRGGSRNGSSRNGGSRLSARIRNVLHRHLSRINAELVLSRACARCGVEPERLEPRHADRFVRAVRPSLGLYLDAARTDDLMRELEGIRQGPTNPTADGAANTVEIPVRSEADIEAARTQALQQARQAGLRNVDAVKCATVVSELARNIVQYAAQGTVTLSALAGPRRGLRMIARDQGPGIPDVESILSGGYRSRTGLGLGIKGSERLMDRFVVRTTPETGTEITAEKHR